MRVGDVGPPVAPCNNWVRPSRIPADAAATASESMGVAATLGANGLGPNNVTGVGLVAVSQNGFPYRNPSYGHMRFYMGFDGFSSIFIAREGIIGPRLLEITRKHF